MATQDPHHIHNGTTAFAQWIIRWRWLVILVTLLGVIGIGFGMRFVGFTGDYHVFFAKENPQLLAFERLENTYTKDDNVFIVLAPKDGNVFTPQTLAAVEAITKAGWQVPYSSRVDSISNFQYTHANGDELIVEDLVTDAASMSAEQAARIRDIALAEPLLANRLVSPDARVTAVNITVQIPGKKLDEEMPAIVTHVRNLVDNIKNDYPQMDVYLTGIVMMNDAFFTASARDMGTLVPLTFLVVLVSVGLLLRGWTGTFGTMWVIIFSIVTALSFSGWVGIKLTPPSSVATTIIMTLAVANGVHILVSMLHAMRHGMQKRVAIVESLRINMQPVFLTSISTAIGFLSMNFSESPPFRDLGNIVAVGMASAFVYSVTFLPALMAILPVRTPRQMAEGENTVMMRLAEFVIRRRSILLVTMAAVVIALASFLPRNELGENFVEYFDKTITFRTDSDFVSDNLGGMYRIDYSLDAKESSGISRPEFLRQVEAFADWYRKQPEAIHVNAITDVMKRLNKNMHADNNEYYRLPDERELSAQYLLLYEMSLPYGLDLNNQINVDKSSTRVSVTIQNLDTPDIIALEERAQAWMASNTPDLKADGSSTTVMFSHIGIRNIHSMILGTTVALVLISFMLIFALRSVKVGLISLLPNLIPAVMGFGLWGLLVGEVNVGLSIVTGMTLGIVVDDTVHFLSKYLRARREKGLNAEDAVRYAFSSVGMALWVTSVVLVAGFMILTLSTFKLNSAMGLLTSIVILFALAADFLLLPPLLMKLDARKKKARTPDTQPVESLAN